LLLGIDLGHRFLNPNQTYLEINGIQIFLMQRIDPKLWYYFTTFQKKTIGFVKISTPKLVLWPPLYIIILRVF
jgi:hypothetical protein